MEKTFQNYAKIGNLKMYYEVSGNTNGDWLILLHGISGSTRCWKYQINDLNKHFRVLNLDLAGHGKSSSLDCDKYNGVVIANYLRLLMDHLCIEKAHILGLSLGTIVEQYFCELFPERVISLVFASPVHKPNYLSRILNNFADKVFLKVFNKDVYLKMMANMMLPGKVHEKSRKFFLNETIKMDDTEFHKWWRVVLDCDQYSFLTRSDIPALIVAGEKDFCFFSDALALKEKFTNHEFRVIKDVGHVLIFQKAQEFNDMVIEYITSLKSEKEDLEEISA
jgi:pimeloyl-ACP methyl ester carboxylesterase